MSENKEKTLASMVTSILDDIVSLLKGHIELAKLEAQESLKNILKSTALFALAIGIAWLGIILTFVALALGIAANGVSLWASFLVVAALLLLASFLFVVLGVKKIKQAKTNRTVSSLAATADSLRTLRDEIK